MFVRFVVSALDGDSGRRQGIFPSAYRLRRSGELPARSHTELTEALAWFDKHLDAPDRFTRGERKHANGLAISWFRDSAKDHVAKLRDICQILNDHGIATEMLATTRPGYVVYEDRQQIAAVPFADTPT